MRWQARVRLIGLALVAITALAASGSAFGHAAQSCGTVVINEQSWAGSTANTYVAKYVLEKRLGCKVKLTQVTEGPPYFQAMRDGKVDVALEDWDDTAGKAAQPYLKDKSVQIVGSNGITGVIGWFIPRYLLKQYPAFRTWRGIKGKESVFKSPSPARQGMFLGGDPSYVQKDRALIQELGLNLKHVVAGASRRRSRAGASSTSRRSRALLLVRPAVPERAVRPGAGAAAEAVQGLPGRREAALASMRASTPRTASTSSSRRSSRGAARRP